MTKEELIDFINSINFELAINMTLTFIKEKPTSYMSEDEKYNAEPKTITFQKDYEKLINEKTSWIDRKIDDLYCGLRELKEREEKNEK